MPRYRLACTHCERRGQYRKATLLERYGADANMVDLRLELAAGCPKIAAKQIMDLCRIQAGSAMKKPHDMIRAR